MPAFYFFLTKHIYVIRMALVMSLLAIPFYFSHAQDLEAIGKEKPIKVSGTIGTTQTLYAVSGIPNRRPPYLAFINGGVTFNIYQWVVPFSVTWSNQNRMAYNQPFSQYGLSPHWKWVTAHIGYRNMTFSQYSLAGHTFLGGGVDLTPGIFRISAMYGRLSKAVKEDTLNASNEIPSYKRMGMGVKIGIGKGADFIDLIWFSAKDDVRSIEAPVKSDIRPAENMVFSVNMQKELAKRIVIAAEYARSAYTRDLRAPIETGGQTNIFSPFFPVRNSTQFYGAFKSSLTYNANLYSLGLMYERIDPQFKTLGTYFFNNDLENITIAPSVRLLKQKMNISANVGVQRNNLNKQELSTVKRILGSGAVSYVPNQRWNFAGQYSNFKTYNKISQNFNQFQTLDTLNFYQVSESAGFNAGYNSTGKEKKHGVNLNFSFQKATQTQGEQITNNTSRFYNTNLAYRFSLVPIQLSITAGVNANQNHMADVNSYGVGPNASVSKLFLDKKLRTSLTTTYNFLLTEKVNTGRAINFVAGLAYRFQKKSNLTFNMIILNKYSKVSPDYTEFTGNLGYSYTF
jgi:hypothetical protein